MKSHHIISVLLILFYTNSLSAQNPNWVVYSDSISLLPSNYINAITEDLDENIWIGTNNGLVKISDDGLLILTNLNSGLPSNYISAIAVDHNNVKWFGLESNGFVKYNDTSWTHYTSSNSMLSSDCVTQIVVDNNNRKWIASGTGCGTGNIMIIDDTLWTIFTDDNPGLPHDTFSSIIFDDSLNVWVALEYVHFNPGGFFGGLYKFDDGTWELFDPSTPGFSTGGISCLKANMDTIWVGTDWGLSKYNGLIWETYLEENSDLPNNYINSLDIDSEGIMWIGTGRRNFDRKGALVKYDAEKWTVFDTTNSPILPGFINQVFIDSRNNKWLGIHPYWVDNTPNDAYGGGLAIYNENGVIVNIKEKDVGSIVSGFYLSKNYPNPFNPKTIIRYSVPINNFVRLQIYNIRGQKIESLVNKYQISGQYEVEFNGTNLASGIYIYTLEQNGIIKSNKMLLIK